MSILVRRIPVEKLNAWLVESLKRSPKTKYGHRLLQESAGGRDQVWDDLVAFVQEAHDDARRCLRRALAPTLSPFETTSGSIATADDDAASGYPSELSIGTLKGYLGEVLAGLVAIHKDPHGDAPWQVPAFLFRFHDVAFQALEVRNDARTQGLSVPAPDDPRSTLPGRTGNDVLAFRLDVDGNLAEVLVCEAKYLTRHRSDKAQEAHVQLSSAGRYPPSLRELIDLLRDYTTDPAIEWRARLLGFRLSKTQQLLRSDLLLYAVGNRPTGRKGRTSWLLRSRPAKSYRGKRRLEVVEIHVADATSLVKRLYRGES